MTPRADTPTADVTHTHADSGSAGVRLQLVFTLWFSFYENHVLNIMSL